MPLPPLSTASLTHRLEIAHLLFPLRRVRPRVPFWDLAAHRIPTLWTLYRGLLKLAPSDDIHFRIRALFRQGRRLTGPQTTKVELEKGYRWLDVLQKAKDGDERWRSVLQRYSRLISAKRHKVEWREIERSELRRLAELANRPVMTGAFFRASIFNKPLPRLKPQPINITGMLTARRRAREQRFEKQTKWQEWKDFIMEESKAEEALGVRGVFGGQETRKEWVKPINELLDSYDASYKLDEQRGATPFPPTLLGRIRDARRERTQNLTRLRHRERKGEILRQTVKRMRQGPPAHVLATMTDWEKKRDRVLRGPSWGGWAGHVKRLNGMKPPKGFEMDNL